MKTTYCWPAFCSVLCQLLGEYQGVLYFIEISGELLGRGGRKGASWKQRCGEGQGCECFCLPLFRNVPGNILNHPESFFSSSCFIS